MSAHPQLKLKNQLCFPLYAVSKEIVRRYKPLLDPIGLTYTQYLVMLVLWEHKDLTVTELGDKLMLDSGTLTPVLKKLESKNYITRQRHSTDERCVTVTLTKDGERLQEAAASIPAKIGNCINISKDEGQILYAILYKILNACERD